MPHKDADRLLILTLNLEAAIEGNDWKQVDELLRIRQEAVDGAQRLSRTSLVEIASIEERILTKLRIRLEDIRGDLRNLSAALRIAAPYGATAATARSSISIAS